MRRIVLFMPLVASLLVIGPAPIVAAGEAGDDAAETSAPAGTYSGQWAGKTKQNKPITWKVNPSDRIARAHAEFHIAFANCLGGVTIESTKTFKPPAMIDGAHFDLDFGGSSPEIEIVGNFTSAHKAKGKLIASYEDFSTGCHGSVRKAWSAHEA